MKKIFFFIFLFLLFSVSAHAKPLGKITAEYNYQENLLHVEVNNKISRATERFVRKLILSKNNKVVDTYYYASQKNLIKFSQDYDIECLDGDVLHVKVYSSEGGTRQTSALIENKDEDLLSDD
ncbi:MAG: hypothetical protein ACI9F2_000531 [Lysobacterales bacterium]|jgi:hypothetical protein